MFGHLQFSYKILMVFSLPGLIRVSFYCTGELYVLLTSEQCFMSFLLSSSCLFSSVSSFSLLYI